LCMIPPRSRAPPRPPISLRLSTPRQRDDGVDFTRRNLVPQRRRSAVDPGKGELLVSLTRLPPLPRSSRCASCPGFAQESRPSSAYHPRCCPRAVAHLAPRPQTSGTATGRGRFDVCCVSAALGTGEGLGRWERASPVVVEIARYIFSSERTHVWEAARVVPDAARGRVEWY
jgi:hypothetical protein